ncbi:DNA-binding transcriptional regulator, MurR/RpiR family, contains HTH and SIS domains [Pseudobutyrivibrio sp. 49]|uniref:MurR/RpiR family transcriptional regulator n=1 Tax=unclassified Pseudobutyrivibrio TaxID=2638619 RepID=UPI0008910413|nr:MULTISPECIES: MurR/RpiR family transcriptional regulator [unclassified Pseudobutyrivibrio]SDH46677.1 DNA-binding transcriptional regulator, MurR/RpiR family, contains HTH and SIS domains [Pseudobutyrivibrio sp. 49]SFN42502.1 transcriptional regulator, RpiR family [Pseudobutyrivibrio sp. UC1225]
MATTTDLISKINEKYGRMSKGQKLLANYIIDNYDKAVFLTAAKLGEIIGISESTVVRFASFIGYSGYPEFQQALEAMVRSKLNTTDRVEITKGGIEQNGVLREVLSSDALKIKNTMESMDEAAFYNAVETLLKARRIYVVGIRSCAPLASFLSFYLNLIFDNVVNLQTSSASELFEQMIHIGEEDCIIGISFPRYSMRTLKALEFANNRQANVITITDSIHSPMNLYSSCNLIAESDMHSVVDSLVAPLSVINALIVELCNRRQAQVADTLEMVENVWNEYQFYENDEIDMVDDSIKMFYPGES